MDLPYAFFKLLRQQTFQKIDFAVKISTFQKKIEISFGGVEWSKTAGTGECLGTTLEQLGWIRNVLEEKKFDFFCIFFQSF